MDSSRFKFRAWDREHKKMHFPDIFGNSMPSNWTSFYDLMQSTGLTDKNGVDIYEGDIVLILYTDWPSQSRENNGRYAMSLDEYRDSISNIGKVVFKDAEFCIQFNDDGCTSSIHCGIHGQIKAIGNIFENKELLAQGG